MQTNKINNLLSHDSISNESKKHITQSNIDTEIIMRLKQGDHIAFDMVFHAFYSKVKSFIRVLTKDDNIADDVSQEVFVNLWTYRANINPNKNFNAYVYSITRNAIMKALRERHKQKLPIEDYEEVDVSLTDDELIAKETALLIKLTVNGMPSRRREVFIMSKYQNKSNNEIAQELNISQKAVEKHLRLALKELREVLTVMLLFFEVI